MDNYYKEFPEIIRQDMSTEEIREKLDERNAVIGNRFDARSLEEQEKIRAALEVFRDEESRRAYDQALAQGDRKPPEEDPRQKLREEQAEWIQRAQDFCKSKDYDLAKAAMDRALEKDKDLPNGTAYRLAAQIYASAEEYAHALRCINEALLLEPENPDYIRIKGAVFGAEAPQKEKFTAGKPRESRKTAALKPLRTSGTSTVPFWPKSWR